MDIKQAAEAAKSYIIEQRRWFHQHPEVSEKEFESCKHIRAELDKMGVEWRAGPRFTAQSPVRPSSFEGIWMA